MNNDLNDLINETIYNAAFALVDSEAQMNFREVVSQLEKIIVEKPDDITDEINTVIVKLIIYERMIEYMDFVGDKLRTYVDKQIKIETAKNNL